MVRCVPCAVRNAGNSMYTKPVIRGGWSRSVGNPPQIVLYGQACACSFCLPPEPVGARGRSPLQGSAGRGSKSDDLIEDSAKTSTLRCPQRGVASACVGWPGVEFSIANFGLDFLDFLEFETDVSANSPVSASHFLSLKRAIRAELGQLGQAPASAVFAACVGRPIICSQYAFLRDV